MEGKKIIVVTRKGDVVLLHSAELSGPNNQQIVGRDISGKERAIGLKEVVEFQKVSKMLVSVKL